MNFHKSPAIILSRKQYGDNDLIVTFLTQEGRCVSAFAKAALKSQKRFGGVLDLFNQVELEWKDKGSEKLCLLQSASLISVAQSFRSDLNQLAFLSYISELAILFHKNADHHLYDFFIKSLERMKVHPVDATLVLEAEYYLLSVFGYRPDFERCVKCLSIELDDAAYLFECENGGIVCPKCSTKGGALKLQAQVVTEMRRAISEQSFVFTSDVFVNALSHALEGFLTQILQQKPRSLDFLKNVIFSKI